MDDYSQELLNWVSSEGRQEAAAVLRQVSGNIGSQFDWWLFLPSGIRESWRSISLDGRLVAWHLAKDTLVNFDAGESQV